MKIALASVLLLAASTTPALADGPCLLGVGLGGATCTGTSSGAPAATTPPVSPPPATVAEDPRSVSCMPINEARQALATGRVITGQVSDDHGNVTHVTYRPVLQGGLIGRAGAGDDLDRGCVSLGAETGWVPYQPGATGSGAAALATQLVQEIQAIDAELGPLLTQVQTVDWYYWRTTGAQQQWLLGEHTRLANRGNYLYQLRATKVAAWQRLQTQPY